MNDSVNRETVLLAINKLATTKTVCFYPDRIAKDLKIKESEAIEYLGELVEQNILIKRYNQVCCHCYYTLGVYDDVKQMPSKIECIICGHMVTNDPECIRPIYYFNQEYKDKVKKQQKYDFKQNRFGTYNDFVMDRFGRKY